MQSPGLRLPFIFTALRLRSATIPVEVPWTTGPGTGASREGGRGRERERE